MVLKMLKLQGLWLRAEVTIEEVSQQDAVYTMSELRDWREVNGVVIAFYKDIFLFLEDSSLLDSNSEFGLFALCYIYLPRINASLEQFVEQCNFHGIRTARYQFPMALWHAGIMHSMDDAVLCEPEHYGRLRIKCVRD